MNSSFEGSNETHYKKSRIRLLAKQDSLCLHITSIAWITLIFKYLFLLLLIIFLFSFRQYQNAHFGTNNIRHACMEGKSVYRVVHVFFTLNERKRKNKILHGCDLQIFEIVAFSLTSFHNLGMTMKHHHHTMFALFAGWLKMYVIFNMKTSIMTSNYNWLNAVKISTAKK